MQVRSLGQENSLENKMATLSSILAWEIPWGSPRSQHDLATKQQTTTGELLVALTCRALAEGSHRTPTPPLPPTPQNAKTRIRHLPLAGEESEVQAQGHRVG